MPSIIDPRASQPGSRAEPLGRLDRLVEVTSADAQASELLEQLQVRPAAPRALFPGPRRRVGPPLSLVHQPQEKHNLRPRAAFSPSRWLVDGHGGGVATEPCRCPGQSRSAAGSSLRTASVLRAARPRRPSARAVGTRSPANLGAAVACRPNPSRRRTTTAIRARCRRADQDADDLAPTHCPDGRVLAARRTFAPAGWFRARSHAGGDQHGDEQPRHEPASPRSARWDGPSARLERACRRGTRR